MSNALTGTLQSRRSDLRAKRNERNAAIAGWERLIATSRALVATYDAEIAEIDDFLGAQTTSTPSTVVLTSDSPITIREDHT